MPMATGSQRQPEFSSPLSRYPRARTGCPVRGSPPPRGKREKTLDSPFRGVIQNGGRIPLFLPLPQPSPSPLEGEGWGEGKKCLYSIRCSTPPASCPCKREARFFAALRMTEEGEWRRKAEWQRTRHKHARHHPCHSLNSQTKCNTLLRCWHGHPLSPPHPGRPM